MKIKLIVFLFLLAAAMQSAFAQTDARENKPKAYLVATSDSNVIHRPTEAKPQAVLVGDTDFPQPRRAYLVATSNSSVPLTRPRVAPEAKTDLSLERQAFALINEARAKYGLAPLAWSEDVARIARLHSENMANFNFFSHAGLDGLMVNERADECGVHRWQAIGENIAYNKGFENPVAFAVEKWMESPAHRENLLSARWKESGVGVAITKDGTYFFTEVFLLRK